MERHHGHVGRKLIVWHQGESWGKLSPQRNRSASTAHCSFSEPSSQSWQVGAILRLHQPGSHCWPHPGDPLRPCPTQLSGPPKLFPGAFPYEWFVLAHVLDFPSFSQTSSISLRGPRPITSISWPWFTAWPLLGTSHPSTSSSHLQITL